MKIPFFNQNITEFFTSKSNWASLAALSIGLFMLSTGDTSMSYLLITQGMTGLGIRDAITKR